mmetsp:Transcript_1397/g.2538  ORF Transcript_1397/g.2538 Transcript_1397/m.2538 type:complete len:162 (-) Transcript_1397:26-511(-)|eukprot:CAMPEP_0182447064 /NCGR_PEP_ID=MMETSP1172-20130603/10994_1 /TAXON_ID=708627 /ORGANISM="Timspurckia oligopyrenoides, Strain CCMP3278" /LENGTH=161 /DNA_ID=CAMNT_0024643343 /DNA_START=65 /DNA_END=550 /DNA_ORIENTATION=+
MNIGFVPVNGSVGLSSSEWIVGSRAVSNRCCMSERGFGRRGVLESRTQSRIQMIEIDQNTVIAIASSVLGVFGGIGLVAWTETQGKRTETRENLQPCVECRGAKMVPCNICKGTGTDPVFKSQEEPCAYCDGKGTTSCDNCTGTGIQPRFLDRLSPEDFMD